MPIRCAAHCLAALFFLAAALSPALAGSPSVPKDWHSGIGLSELADPLAAADEAAGEANAALEGTPAKFVFVGAANSQVVPELVEGVKKHFPAEIIYGCQVSSPLVAESNFPDVKTIDIPAGVEVWALGGDVDIEVFTVSTDIEDADVPYEEAGIQLGQRIRPSLEALSRPGKLIFTFGDQYNGSNKELIAGLNEGLDGIYLITGGAAGNKDAKEIVKGEIVTGTDVAVLIGGEFRLAHTLKGGTHTPETADEVLATALEQGGKEEPFFAMLFNCRRRRQGMIENNQLAGELENIRRRLPGMDFFGFYGPGEVGSEKPGDPSKGVGFTITATLFYAVK